MSKPTLDAYAYALASLAEDYGDEFVWRWACDARCWGLKPHPAIPPNALVEVMVQWLETPESPTLRRAVQDGLQTYLRANNLLPTTPTGEET